MEYSSFETLASLLESGDRALLTTMDQYARSHTSPVRSLRTPFLGHLWLDTGRERTPARNIGEGGEVTVVYGDADAGPYVTVSGWAVVLPQVEGMRDDHRHRFAGTRAAAGEATPLLCVTVRAAELSENGARQRGRIFAFAPSQQYQKEDWPAAGRRGFASMHCPLPANHRLALAPGS